MKESEFYKVVEKTNCEKVFNFRAIKESVDALRENWNHWCQTGEVLFEHASKRTDGKW